MYRKVDSSLDFVSREQAILDFWEEHDIFKKQVALNQDGPTYTVYDGPPTANGKPHIGHVLTRAMKDIIPRYQSMLGKHVLRKAGWDTHGLPVELEVEKSLGLNSKDQIEEYGIEKFIKECKKSVWTYRKDWEDLSRRVGYWFDLEDPYVTYDQNYIEAEWWAMKELDKKGLLYQGSKVTPYCPRCGTSLASHEVAQGYQEVTETSVYIRFRVQDEADCYFAAWTTTPWTLPSNLALAVHPQVEYVLVERREEGKSVRYYLAKDLVSSVFPEESLKVVKEMTGEALVGMTYEPIFPYAQDMVARSGKQAFRVLPADYVTTTDGTGIVHIAPAFGEDDAKIGQKFDLPFVQLVTDQGLMSEEVTDFAGIFTKKADPLIIEKLKAEGKLIRSQAFTHNYPFCWRCDTPLIYYARQGWFIAMTKLHDQLMENNSRVNWLPKTIGEKRFGNFLDNVIDWNISRERYWGMPLPIWICPHGHRHVVGSIEELKAMSPDCPDDIELHRPYIDQVHLTCPECGELMTRVPEVMDCWFDSGSMPFAQWHYPMENADKLKAHFPADFICEAVDQTRGWFYSLMALNTALFGQSPYKSCLVLGHVQDKNGQKMSKHKGNVVDPNEIFDQEGADATRWYFYSNSQPWLPSRFSLDSVNEDKRKFMGTLWNTYAFFVLYADIDQFESKGDRWSPQDLCVMDRWILSRLNSLIFTVRAGLDEINILKAARAMEKFVDDLSNWYVRRGRERYWVAGMPKDKEDAYECLYRVLVTLAKLSAPFTPFLAETLYQNLVVGHRENAPESVHLTRYPEGKAELIDRELEDQMALVLDMVALGRTARSISQLKTRQPLSRMLVVSEEKLSEEYIPLVTSELNVKTLEWAEGAEDLLDYEFKPQLRLLGKRFGARLPELKQVLANLDGRRAYQQLQAQGYLEVEMADGPEKLTEEELLVETLQATGFASASAGELTVALDTTLTEALKQEGLLREMVSKIQVMRKESGFEVTDRIRLFLACDPALNELVQNHREELLRDVLGVALADLTEAPAELRDRQQSFDINGHRLDLILQVVA